MFYVSSSAFYSFPKCTVTYRQLWIWTKGGNSLLSLRALLMFMSFTLLINQIMRLFACICMAWFNDRSFFVFLCVHIHLIYFYLMNTIAWRQWTFDVFESYCCLKIHHSHHTICLYFNRVRKWNGETRRKSNSKPLWFRIFLSYSFWNLSFANCNRWSKKIRKNIFHFDIFSHQYPCDE